MIDKQELRNRILKTKESRFNTSKRLMNHQRISQWIMSIISACLIVLPLIDVRASLKSDFDIIQSIVAVFLLIYSLIIPAENFMYRSMQMHKCARDLDGLIFDIDNGKNLKEISKEYSKILDSHENHETIDYLPVKYHGKLQSIRPETFSKVWHKYIYYKAVLAFIPIRLFVGYIYYIPLIAAFVLLAIRFIIPAIR